MYRISKNIVCWLTVCLAFSASAQEPAQESDQDAKQDVEVRSFDGGVRLMVDEQIIAQTTNQVADLQVVNVNGAQKRVASWREKDAEDDKHFYSIQVGQNKWSQPRAANYQVFLKSGSFTPEPGVARAVAADWQAEVADTPQLYYVQFVTPVLPEYRESLKKLNAEMLGYIPNYCHIVRMTPDVAGKVNALGITRFTDLFHPRYKVGAALVDDEARNYEGRKRFTIYATSDKDREKLADQIKELDGRLFESSTGKRLISAELEADKLMPLLRLPTVQWVEPWQEIEEDMDNARIQGGADFVESSTSVPDGYTGIGIRGHVMEGVESTHSDFAANTYRQTPIAVTDGGSSSHGHATYGIVFGSGINDPQNTARGMLPNAQGYFTHYRALTAPTGGTGPGSRYELVGRLIADHEVMFQTASWGNGRTTDYTAHSAEMDRIIFDHDIPITQSQSNAGTRMSRPQAWAKNIISVGGVVHHNNSNPGDDSWQDGNASIGPAEDGRKKPDICAYYDATRTTDLSDGYRNFGGTSGATPIVAGHVGLALEMWGRGEFGNPVDSTATPFENRPRFTTTKALLITSAQQYQFNSTSTDLLRPHQGWGFPDLKKLYENRDKLFIVNESDVLSLLDTQSYQIRVGPGESVLKVCMTYADPPAEPNSSIARVNDLTLRVTAPDGTTYWGNHGLNDGVVSVAGGLPDDRDTVECVFVQNPSEGNWTIDVIADEVPVDAHVETPAVDADFALVALGITNSNPPKLILSGCCGQFHLLGQTGTAAYCFQNGMELAALEFDKEDESFWYYRETDRHDRQWAVSRACCPNHFTRVCINDPSDPGWQLYECMSCVCPGTFCCCWR